MIRGLYTAGTGMMIQRRKMEIVTNNIVNAETSGYKKEMLVAESFDDVMLRRINDTDGGNVGPYNFGVRSEQIYLDFDEGAFESTEKSTDFAIAGDGFFVIDTPAGERYTRASNYMIDNNGYLVNPDGYFLQGENGPILVGQGQEPAVSENGGVFVGNELIDTIRLVSFEDKNVLRKEGDNLFSAPDGLAYESDEGVIKQGFVENSNVSAAQEMVDMITVYRAYESNQRILKMVDEIAGRAVNEIGGLR